MESWQTDILATLEAGAARLEAAQGEIAKAYRLAINHIGLTGASMSESTTLALSALQTTLEHASHLNWARSGSDIAAGDPVLDLLYLLTTLELLKRAREAIASALESAWEQAASAPFQPEGSDEIG